MISTTTFQIILGSLAILATILNLIYAFTPAVYAKLDTKQMDPRTVGFQPNNPFGPSVVYPKNYYLDLVILNVGTGTAENIRWTLTKKEKKEDKIVRSGKFPYLGRGNETVVLGYIECATTVDKESEISYEVDIKYKRLFGLRRLSIWLKYNGSGNLVCFKKLTLIGRLISKLIGK